MIKLYEIVKKILFLENELNSKTKEETIIDYIKDLINGTEFENKSFIAGGYVRDMVMGKKSKDIDITVSLPNGGIKLAEYITKKSNVYKENSNPVIFPKFGTAKFNLNRVTYKGIDLSNIDVECVMTRKEQYKFGDRKPDVEYGTPEQDVKRRDLTINSLLYDISNNKILDLTGKGIDDIKNKIIRTTGDADSIFKEDPLRMMRVIRFSTKFDWSLSDEMLESIKKNYKMLEYISIERIQDEFNKILLSNTAENGIVLLMDSGLMKYIIPELYQLKGMKQTKHHAWDTLEHTLNVIKNTPQKLEIRLAALLHDIGKIKTKTDDDKGIHFYGHEDESARMTKNILSKLKYSTLIIQNVSKMVAHHMKTKEFGNDLTTMSDKTVRRLIRDLGESLEDTLNLIHADNISHGPIGWTYNLDKQIDILREKIKKMGEFTAKTKLPVDGKKIMDILQIKPGRIIKILLDKFEEYFLEDPDRISKMSDEEIEKLLKKLYQEIV